MSTAPGAEHGAPLTSEEFEDHVVRCTAHYLAVVFSGVPVPVQSRPAIDIDPALMPRVEQLVREALAVLRADAPADWPQAYLHGHHHPVDHARIGGTHGR